MRHRTLVLRKETLTELASDELSSIVGGTSNDCVTYTKIPTGCICTGIYPSLNVDCPVTKVVDTVTSLAATLICK